MKALSRPLLGPELRKSEMAEGGPQRIQCKNVLAFLFPTSEVLPMRGMDQNCYHLRALACWFAVLHMAALRSIAVAFSSVYFLLASSFAAQLGARIVIILFYGAWVLIFLLGVTTATLLQTLLPA